MSIHACQCQHACQLQAPAVIEPETPTRHTQTAYQHALGRMAEALCFTQSQTQGLRTTPV